MVVNALQILIEGGPISQSDVEKELGILHTTFFSAMKKLNRVGHINGNNMSRRRKKFYFYNLQRRKFMLVNGVITGCKIYCDATEICMHSCSECGFEKMFNLFKRCRFKYKTQENLKRDGYDDSIYHSKKNF